MFVEDKITSKIAREPPKIQRLPTSLTKIAENDPKISDDHPMTDFLPKPAEDHHTINSELDEYFCSKLPFTETHWAQGSCSVNRGQYEIFSSISRRMRTLGFLARTRALPQARDCSVRLSSPSSVKTAENKRVIYTKAYAMSRHVTSCHAMSYTGVLQWERTDERERLEWVLLVCITKV